MKMFSGEFENSIDKKSRVLIPPQSRGDLKEKAVLRPRIEKRSTAYVLPEWKKQVVCNFLVRMRANGFNSGQTTR